MESSENLSIFGRQRSDIKQMMILKAKDFNSRKELEQHIKQEHRGYFIGAAEISKKEDCVIEGTRADLAKLRLSGATLFFGVHCIETDAVAPGPPTERVNRGRQTGFGIDNSDNKNPNL